MRYSMDYARLQLELKGIKLTGKLGDDPFEGVFDNGRIEGTVNGDRIEGTARIVEPGDTVSTWSADATPPLSEAKLHPRTFSIK